MYSLRRILALRNFWGLGFLGLRHYWDGASVAVSRFGEQCVLTRPCSDEVD